MSWTQPCCDACWAENHSGIRLDGRIRRPVRVADAALEEETCCYCGVKTTSGIYVRADPTTVPYPQEVT